MGPWAHGAHGTHGPMGPSDLFRHFGNVGRKSHVFDMFVILVEKVGFVLDMFVTAVEKVRCFRHVCNLGQESQICFDMLVMWIEK